MSTEQTIFTICKVFCFGFFMLRFYKILLNDPFFLRFRLGLFVTRGGYSRRTKGSNRNYTFTLKFSPHLIKVYLSTDSRSTWRRTMVSFGPQTTTDTLGPCVGDRCRTVGFYSVTRSHVGSDARRRLFSPTPVNRDGKGSPGAGIVRPRTNGSGSPHLRRRLSRPSRTTRPG